ncbi:MAG TPA: dephospho-CoA kinase [Micromonospora sp.]
MLKVGLTGGIGAGKSAVAARLAAHGAVIIDADRIAREVVAPGTDGLREIVEAFGADVLAPDGTLNRPALAALVFRDEAARRRLERITHPRIRARSDQLAAAAPPDAVVVHDVPLLVESGTAATYHLVIVVEAPQEIRIARLVQDRGMTRAQAIARIATQATDAERRAVADVILHNDGTLADLAAQVDALWRDRLVPYEQHVRQRRPAASPEALRAADPRWPADFARVAARIRAAVGDQWRIDHIGATAVPGLPARDIIDIQLAVASVAEADALADRLAQAGFPRCPDSAPSTGLSPERAERRHASADPGRPVDLRLRVAESPEWRFALLVRDFLRADASARADYLAIRQDVSPLEAYAERKRRWFMEIRPRAERWAAETGWRP